MNIPRVLVAGLRGGSGKTLVSLGLVAAWRRRGRIVAPFKKGPDYIDASWLSVAAGRPCRNLDQFLLPDDQIRRSFGTAVDADVALIEGNRGLFDGVDSRGSFSTAELAKLLRTPVVLVVDCTKATRTVATQVLGCLTLDSEVVIGGVVLNYTSGARHETVIREAIRQDCGLEVFGAVRRNALELFPERHLGLLPPQERSERLDAVDRAADLVESELDLPAVLSMASAARELTDVRPPGEVVTPKSVTVGVFRDAAFSFYYPENLEALQNEGAKLVEVSPLQDGRLPAVDALYIGGGFPEVFAPELEKNVEFHASLRQAADSGLPIYAECGGAVYLGDRLRYEGSTFSMCGVLPVSFAFDPRPRGHGYTELETVRPNPFFAVGEMVRGHEFHYTHLDGPRDTDVTYAFHVHRGQGFGDLRDGLCRHNVLASYSHVHALGVSSWAPSLVRAAVRFKTLSGATANRS